MWAILNRLYRVSYFPTFPTKWFFPNFRGFVLLSYFFAIVRQKFAKNKGPKYIYATIFHKNSPVASLQQIEKLSVDDNTQS